MEKLSGVSETMKIIMLSTLGAVSKLKRKICWEVILFDRDLNASRNEGFLVKLLGKEERFREPGKPGFKYHLYLPLAV